ncbi:uncharacterized protein Asalp_06850 [Aeromonas salmonicida subsp. pectinolytica 34mel]|uniref:Uncharacterized protein n=1 Tax=Aeromonas salmonicida subsp. pectinolytica 34mel TaxID=1324960 RepID=A0A2D1QCI6_AERSA|nr:uncharacterized protein Asalp_06850 [Aeromonas salmonicida subsp. pectinolytica 34mel]
MAQCNPSQSHDAAPNKCLSGHPEEVRHQSANSAFASFMC